MDHKIETRNGTDSSLIHVGEAETPRNANKIRRKSSFIQTPRTTMQLRANPTPDWLAELQGTKQLQKRSATPTTSSQIPSKRLNNKANDTPHPAQMVSSDETSLESLTNSKQASCFTEKPEQKRLTSAKKSDHLSQFFSWPTSETLASFFNLLSRLPQALGFKYGNNQPAKVSGRNIDITADEIAPNNIDVPHDVTRTPLHNTVLPDAGRNFDLN